MRYTKKCFTYDKWASEDIYYKKFDRNQFDSGEFNLKLTKVFPTEEGYCSDEINNYVNLEVTDLTAINTGTGSGKSTAIYQMIIKAADNGYSVIVASPKKSLVQKDYDCLLRIAKGTKTIATEEIVHYGQLSNLSAKKDYEFIEQLAGKKIHVMTVSCLCRNAGEDAEFQMRSKSLYLDKLIEDQKSKGRKVILVMDELHESVQYVPPKFLQNLSPFKKIIHKIIVSSATYTEASFALVKLLSQMVNKQIKLIEAPRIRLPQNRQSDLQVYIASSSYTSELTGNNDGEYAFIKRAITEGLSSKKFDRVHVLTFSESLARNIYEAQWIPKGKANLTIGALRNNYDSNNSNIGTTFSTGIDVTHKDLFVIILPGTVSQGGYPNPEFWGIFQQGKVIIEQAVARVRNGGKIMVMMPPIKKLIKGDYIEHLSGIIPAHLMPDQIIDIREREDEFSYIRGRYLKHSQHFKLYNGLSDTDFTFEGELQNKSFSQFQMEESQRLLIKNCYWSGREVYPYFIYAACTGQFPNCKPPVFVYRSSKLFYYAHDHIDLIGSIQKFVEANLEEVSKLAEEYTVENTYKNLCTLFRGGTLDGWKIVLLNFGSTKNFGDYIFQRELMMYTLKWKCKIDDPCLGHYFLYRAMEPKSSRDNLNELYDQFRITTATINVYLKMCWAGYFPTNSDIESDQRLNGWFNDLDDLIIQIYKNDLILRQITKSLPVGITFFKKYLLNVSKRDTTHRGRKVYPINDYLFTKMHVGLDEGDFELY